MTEMAAALREKLDRLGPSLRLLSESEVAASRGTLKWTRKEILGHLIDSALNNHRRFVGAQLGDHSVWPGYDQDAWVHLHRYSGRPWTELVELWIGINRQVASVIEAIEPERLTAIYSLQDCRPATLAMWIGDYLAHLDHHLAQIMSATDPSAVAADTSETP